MDFQKLPFSVFTRMKLERSYIVMVKTIKKVLKIRDTNSSAYYPMVRNNRFYGDEYILKEYSGFENYVYSIIEHGLYFGNNCAKVGLKHEWELGTVITSGTYRAELLKKYYPEYFVKKIGPMIHYANIDLEFKKKLKEEIDVNKKTLLFFPVHGNALISPVYDIKLVIDRIIDIANDKQCWNIIVCAFFSEYTLFKEVISEIDTDGRIVVTTCGNRYSENFLSKQKTLISLADLTISNSLGTHLGYCIYLGKPHILLQQDFHYNGNEQALEEDFGKDNRSKNWNTDFENEKLLFQKIFNINEDSITQEQYELCNYYWGFDDIKSPEELYEILYESNKYAIEYVKKWKG